MWDGAPPFAAAALALLAAVGFAIWLGAAFAADIIGGWQGGALGDPRRPPAAVLFGLIGASLILVSVRWQILAARARKRWSKVDGTVVSLEVARKWSPSSSKHPSGIALLAFPVIRYSYRFGETQHIGERLRFGGIAAFPAARATRFSRFRPGMSVVVFVDPEDPMNSVLEPRAEGAVVVLLLSAIFFALSGHLGGFI